jgi:hypothetical protein
VRSSREARCDKCKKTIGKCECPDMDERLEILRVNGWITYPMCSKCFRHYARCKCVPRGRPILTTDN